MTVRQVTDRIVELGLVDAQTPAQALGPEVLDETLDYFGESDHEAVLSLLDHLGIRYSTDYKTFRYPCQSDGAVYREELDLIAACGRGRLTITDVALVDDANGHHLLRFRCAGQPHEWQIGHGPNEEFEAQLTFATSIGDLVPAGSSARWCSVDPPDPDVGSEAVFGDPEALRQLGARFGLTFEPMP
jgi:hypothetical protein